jgi:hypothetical protein
MTGRFDARLFRLALCDFYGPGFGDGAGCVGLAFGDDGVVTGSVVVEAPVFVWSTLGRP